MHHIVCYCGCIAVFHFLSPSLTAVGERPARSISLGGEEEAPPPVLPKRMGKKVRASSFPVGEHISILDE